MTRRRVVVCAVLWVLMVGSGAMAQTPPAAPSIDSVSVADAALGVVWTAPSGVVGITAYDLRYIRSDAADKADINWSVHEDVWTSGPLEYTVLGLVNGVGYDIQIRAVTDADGAWSATSTGTPAAAAPTLVVGDTALTAVWSTPGDVDEDDVMAYDLRYIRSDAADKADINWSVHEDVWTSGRLRFVLSGLVNGVGYDIQIRAVTDVDGAWSRAGTATPTEPGSTSSDAVVLPLDIPVGGSISPGADTDYYQMVVSERTRVVVFTTGEVDTVGVLEQSDGTEIRSNDDSHFTEGWENFVVWGDLEAGTYYLKVTSSGEDTGSYVLYAETIPQTSMDNPLDAQLNTVVNGVLDATDDEAYFTIGSAAALTGVIIRTTSNLDLRLELFEVRPDDTLRRLPGSDDGLFGWELYSPFIHDFLHVGRTYVVKVTIERSEVGYEDRRPDLDSSLTLEDGVFTLHLEEVGVPGRTVATAKSLPMGRADGGAFTNTPVPRDKYFRIDVEEAADIEIYAAGKDGLFDIELLDSAEVPIEVPIYASGFGATDRGLQYVVRDYLDAGTYYLKASPRSSLAHFAPFSVYWIGNRFYPELVKYCPSSTATIEDPFYGCQWHLKNTGQFGGTAGEDINVEEVWTSGNLGAGVNVLVVDSGVDIWHEDLSDNVDTTLVRDSSDSAQFGRHHGTGVAGVIAARDDDVGIRGVAPRATVAVYNLTYDEANPVAAMTYKMDVVHVSNNSYTPSTLVPFPSVSPDWEEAVEQGITEGLGGKGVFYVFSAGNDAEEGRISNFNQHVNFYGVSAACSVNNQGVHSAYSEIGANLWLCAPSDDTSGPYILSTRGANSYTTRWGGTSSAAPTVSGVAALVRAANTDLTWRDVKLVLANSARKNDPTDDGWATGALEYGSDSARYDFNHKYGFGVVDAKAAVDQAASWTVVPSMVKISVAFDGQSLTVPDDQSTATSSVTIGPTETGATCQHEDGAFETVGDGELIAVPEFVEFVEINTDFDAPSFRDLTVKLVSPTGAVSYLSYPLDGRKIGLQEVFRFGSARHLGEAATGEWEVQIIDEVSGRDTATLNGWCLTIYGHRYRPGPPQVSVARGENGLTAKWTAPTNTGASEVTGYELRHKQSSAGDDDWSLIEDLAADLDNYTIDVDSQVDEYDIEVRAVNSHGDGPWAIATADPEVTVSFGLADYSVAEGDDVTVTVTLSADPERTVTIPITKSNQDGASDADYSGVPASVTINSGETSKSFTFAATDDTDDDDGESVDLAFGTLPAQVTAGTPATSTVTIGDNDDPEVTVSFGLADYSVAEGDDVTVTVTLSADPERTVTIPITKSNQDGASDADYSGVPASVTINSGETSKSFTFAATDDTDDDDGESVDLAFGTLPAQVTAGTPATSTVTIGDNDDPEVTVSFGLADYSVAEGDDVTVTVTLSADPERTVTIPITKSNQDGASDADYSGVPASVTINSGETSKSFTFAATDDTDDDDGESVDLAFGTLPAQVTAGTPATSTVTIGDNDDPEVTVSFGLADYSVAEGDDVTVTVTLSADPERTVTIPITKSNQDGASDADYSGVPASVTINSGETSKSFTFAATDDTDDDDGESVDLAFGTLPAQVTAGTPATSTVTIGDNDDPEVTVSFGLADYSVAEGDDVTVTVTLSADPERTVTIPITKSNQDGASDADYSGVPASVTINSGETSKSFTFAATDDTDDDDGESVDLAFGTLPAQVTAGTPATSTVTIGDNDDPEVTVSFGLADYSVAEGDDVTVTVTLSADPERTVTIPITKSNQDGASDADYSGVPASVTINSGETSKSFTFAATDDTDDDDGESVDLAFGTLPAQVTAGTPATSTVTIGDNDDHILAPRNLMATGGLDRRIELTWTMRDNSEVISFEYRVSSDDGTSWNPDWSSIPGSTPSTTDYTVRDLTNSVLYTIQIRAVFTEHESPPATATAQPLDPPTRANTPVITDINAGDGRISVYGKSNDDPRAPDTSYLVQYRRTGTSNWTTITVDRPTDGRTVFDTQITGLANQTHHDVRIAATNRIGTSNYSDIIVATPQAPSSSPPGPIGVNTLSVGPLGAYWTDKYQSDSTHADVDPLSANTIENDCSGTFPFVVVWTGPGPSPQVENRTASEWAVHIQTAEGAGHVTHVFATSDFSDGFTNLYGQASLQGFSIISIRVRGLFGDDWGTWSPSVNLFCLPHDIVAAAARDHSSQSVLTMGLWVPDLDLARVRKWIDGRNAALPSRARGLIRYEIDAGGPSTWTGWWS